MSPCQGLDTGSTPVTRSGFRTKARRSLFSMWYNHCMNRIEYLKKKIQALYEAKNPNRADWADWLYTHHVFVVSENARILAKRYGANEELAMAAAMLHDVADAEMSRFDDRHKNRSIELASEFSLEAGFSEKEVEDIIDALRHHNCRDGQIPSSLEGKVMATADAVAHVATNYYVLALEVLVKEGKTKDQMSSWALPKIERDFKDKIFFDEVREEVRDDYERVKALFSKQ